MAGQIRWSPQAIADPNTPARSSRQEKIFHSFRIVYRLRGDVIEIATICHDAKPLPQI
ncbi:MAG: hypothetical protein HY897_06170 [Deltaproteobacteria bacterium]|nr:hypothetical protein [Deltaproteobacteria bacterium]